jgi:type IV pilus assembly protein PilC
MNNPEPVLKSKFSFSAIDQEGRRITGIFEASNLEDAMKTLSSKNYTITKINPVNQSFLSEVFKKKTVQVKKDELVTFSRVLGAMLNSGLGIMHAIDIMTEDIKSPALLQILFDLSAGINTGASFTNLLRRYPEVFDKLYVSMVQAGENTGNLPAVLTRLANNIQKMESVKKSVKSALNYPIMVIAFSFLIGIFLFAFVLPKFKSIYTGMGAKLPLPTQVLINISNVFAHYWFIILAIIGLLVFFAPRLLKSEALMFKLDEIFLKLPIVGNVFRYLTISRFSESLNLLYSCGIPIVQSMELVSGCTGNRVMEKTILNSIKDLRAGEPLTFPLRRSKIFTSMAVNMILIGEESGNLTDMLAQVAEYYEQQVDTFLKNLTVLIEPIIMIIVGLGLGVLIIILCLPLVKMLTIMNP